MITHWALPEEDYWSTPFAQALLKHLELFPGAKVLDVAAGGGIPAFYLADQVGSQGEVLAVDIHQHRVLHSRSSQGSRMPWLRFEVGDMRQLPPDLQQYDRITGNIAFMFFRPDRPAALKSLLQFLKPGGQIVLTFPSQGTFDSLWNHVRLKMQERKLANEITALQEYLDERPSADHARQWLGELGMERIEVAEYPLEVATGSGREFLEHPLLRGGFLDDIYECFKDQKLAGQFMEEISNQIEQFTPLYAQRCAMSAWMPASNK